MPPATCQRCQTPLPTGKQHGHCPRCLLDLALAPRATTQRTGSPPPAIAELQPLFADYELHELLGRGGMGAVYRARHTRLDRLVALKVLLPDLGTEPSFAERFAREARALARLRHPGIVGIHDFGRAGTFFFLVMEYVDGASLRDLLLQGRLGARDVLAYVPQLCDALQYAHDQGIVHRDIKPENILIDGDGHVHIADFGLAKLTGAGADPLPLTRSAQMVGTPHYMAPEQIQCSHLVDHRADLYSLGVVLYEMLTGQLPIGRFQPPSAKAPAAQSLDPVVMRSLENDPAERYQAASDVKRDVEATRTSEPTAAAATTATATATAGNTTAPSAAPPLPTSHQPRTATPPRLRADTLQRALATTWPAWLASGVVLVACLLPWMELRDPGHENSLDHLVWLMNQPLSDAFTARMFGVPAWLLLPLTLLIATLGTLRTRGHAVERWLPPALALAGFGYCCVWLVGAAASDSIAAGLGVWLASATFGALAWHQFVHGRDGAERGTAHGKTDPTAAATAPPPSISLQAAAIGATTVTLATFLPWLYGRNAWELRYADMPPGLIAVLVIAIAVGSQLRLPDRERRWVLLLTLLTALATCAAALLIVRSGERPGAGLLVTIGVLLWWFWRAIDARRQQRASE
ncbi:MAG: serine/threonine protein kinase [Planctomycetes bacterium]|nr:serine/threonine protein kinase [Planctomycetota bacterium]